jgi:hypothetical protein
MALVGQTLYLAGGFSAIAGQPRNGLAAIDIGSGAPTAWQPLAPGEGSAGLVVADGNRLFVSGSFTRIGGVDRSYLAEFDLTTGNATAWNAGLTGFVRALAVSGSTVVLGGDFNAVGGAPREGYAAVSRSSGALLPFGVGQLRYGVSKLLAVGSDLWVGGTYTLYGGTARTGVAALDTFTGAPTAWNPGLASSKNGAVGADSLAVFGNTVFLGGSFEQVDGQPRAGLAAVDAQTGRVRDWNSGLGGASDSVGSMVLDSGTLYVSGNFSTLGGAPRSKLAAFDAASLALRPWAPVAFEATPLSVAGGRVYTPSTAFDASTGQRLAWQPDTRFNGNPRPALDVVATPTAVYLQGFLEAVGTSPRFARAAAVDPVTAAVLPWTSFNTIDRLFWRNSTLYGVTSSTTILGESRYGLVTMDPITGAVLKQLATLDGPVRDIVVAGDAIFVSGRFGAEGTTKQGLMLLPR